MSDDDNAKEQGKKEFVVLECQDGVPGYRKFAVYAPVWIGEFTAGDPPQE